MGFIRRCLIKGLLIVLPIAGTVFLLMKVYEVFHNSIFKQVRLLINYFGVPDIPFLEVVFLFIILVLLGFLGGNWIGAKFVSLINFLFKKMPFVRSIFSIIQQVSKALFQDKKSFSEVLLVEYPRKGVFSIGFLTTDAKGEIAEHASNHVTVFMPTTPNPTSGVLIFVPKEDVIRLKMSVEAGIKLVMSAGIIEEKQ